MCKPGDHQTHDRIDDTEYSRVSTFFCHNEVPKEGFGAAVESNQGQKHIAYLLISKDTPYVSKQP